MSIAVCPCLDSRNQISLRIHNLETPSFSRTVYRIFSDTHISVMGIAKGHSCSLSCRDIDRFHRGVTDPVRVIHFNFLCIQRPNRQIRNRYASVRPGGKGRAGNRLCAGGIGVKTNLPTIQILACVRFLDQFQRTCGGDGSYPKVYRQILIRWVCLTAQHHLITAVIPHEEGVSLGVYPISSGCYQDIVQWAVRGYRQHIPVRGKGQPIHLRKGIPRYYPITVRYGCTILTAAIRFQIYGRSSILSRAGKAGDGIAVRCHVCRNLVVCRNDILQPTSDGDIHGSGFRTFSVGILKTANERIIGLRIWRCGISPANRNFPDNDLRCHHIGQLLITGRLRKCSLPIHNRNAHGFQLLSSQRGWCS